jgi:hypothetical protein
LSTVTANVTLPASTSIVTISWSSSNTAVFSDTGVVIRPTGSHATLTLTGTFTSTVDPSVTQTIDWPVRVLHSAATFDDFLNVSYEVQSGQLVNTAYSGIYYTPELKGTATIVTGGAYSAVHTGTNGYIDLGPKVGTLVRSSEWTIEFYIWTPNDSGHMLAFGNDPQITTTTAGNWRGTMVFLNPNLNFRIFTAGQTGQTTTGNSGGIGTRTGGFVHLALVKQGNYVNIYRNGSLAQNNRDTSFAALVSNAVFGSGNDDLEPLRYGYLGRPMFTSQANVSNVRFYGFKVYSKAIYPVTSGSGTVYFDGSSVGPLTTAMRTFKATLSTAFGGSDTAN